MASTHVEQRRTWWLWLDRSVLALLLATLFLLPFERPAPLFSAAGLVVTNLEALALLTVAVWLVRLVLSPPRSFHVPYFTWPAAAIIVSACLAALAASSFQLTAWKVTARWSLGIVFALALADTLRRTRAARQAFSAIVLGALAAAVLGLMELVGVSWVGSILTLFKDAPAQLGAAVRLSATFGSANTAAMLFETALCLALGLALDAAYRRRRLAQMTWAACLVLLAAALALTYSRGGIAAAAVGVAVACGLAATRMKGLDGRALALTTLGMAVVVAAVLALNPVLRARLAVWDSRPMDAASIAAPATLTADGGSILPVTVSATNTGRLTWAADGPESVALSYHWLTEDRLGVAEWDNARLALPADVSPGGTATLHPELVAPVAGRYALAWDLVHAPDEWLGTRDAMPGWTEVVTSGSGGTPFPPASAGRTPEPPPDRGVLWRAALQMARERPILGVGPGNFRHLYGQYLGAATWDDRILANNLYLEILADVGLIGLAAWAWLFVAAVSHLWRRRKAEQAWPYAIALLAALAAWLTHGLFDVAFETTGVYMLLWALIGLAASLDVEPDVRS
ncbi:MAG: O-antigen ligase family protein [Anaerolineae bacterium]